MVIWHVVNIVEIQVILKEFDVPVVYFNEIGQICCNMTVNHYKKYCYEMQKLLLI